MTILRISEETAARLARQAAAHGLSVDSWVEELANEKARTRETQPEREEILAAIASILEIQKRVNPDPEGWTVRDYIDYGRR